MSRWTLKDNGILWDVKKDTNLPHSDHLEMSGTLVSQYIEYGVDQSGELLLSQDIIYPTLRTIPNDTHGSLIKRYEKQLYPVIIVNGKPITSEKPVEIFFDGILKINSVTDRVIDIKRSFFPTRDHMTAIQNLTLINTTKKPLSIDFRYENDSIIKRGCFGIYILESSADKICKFTLKPHEQKTIGIYYSGRKLLQENCKVDSLPEESKRRRFLDGLRESLQLITPDDVLNRAFEFAKIRSAESVFMTKSGYLHSPGGRKYYAGIWANDQAEYAAPFFPFLGEDNSIEATMNCFRLFMPFMGPDYTKIPSSIIAEGLDIWEGAGDRGDAAMYAYGASRFALALGDKKIGEELWWAIKWCLKYCNSKMTKEGVIASDSDELEGRFPSGHANLSVSSLTYGALISSSFLAKELGKIKLSKVYKKRAKSLRKAIENYFGANVEGFDTYRYYDGNEVLRSWICLPLTMGITKRKEQTIKALLSPSLWTEDGLATQSGDETFWDRSTLYGLRGVFSSGESDKALKYLRSYSDRRTLGEHVPYAVEAYPEGDQRHLSAESALYCRIFTEGIFGITPIGFNSFSLKPNIPKEWDKIELKNIKAFRSSFNLEIENNNSYYDVLLSYNNKSERYTIPKGESADIVLN